MRIIGNAARWSVILSALLLSCEKPRDSFAGTYVGTYQNSKWEQQQISEMKPEVQKAIASRKYNLDLEPDSTATMITADNDTVHGTWLRKPDVIEMQADRPGWPPIVFHIIDRKTLQRGPIHFTRE